MFKNNLRIGFRHLFKRKLYSAINILGLAISLAACLVLWTYARFELTYDNFHPKADRVYRVNTSLYAVKVNPFTAYDVGPELKQSVPGIANYIRTHWAGAEITFRGAGSDTKTVSVDDAQFADSTFFKVFKFKPVVGDLATSLNKPYSIALGKTLACRLFKGPESAIGQTVEFKCEMLTTNFTVTAVFEEGPENSNLRFPALASIDQIINSSFYREAPRWDNFITYVVLEKNVTPESLRDWFPYFVKGYLSGQRMTYVPEVVLQPLLELHLGRPDPRQGRDLSSVYFFLLISLLILVIAWVNFINLSTARALERAREVGVKKAIGVMRRQLVFQFLTESLLVNVISIFAAVVAASLLMRGVSEIVGKNIPLPIDQPFFYVVLLGLVGGGTLLSGIYPAFVLSSFKTVNVIKGTPEKVGGVSLRKALIVVQFGASLVLLIFTAVIQKQIVFMKDADKGLKTDQMLIIPAADNITGNAEERTLAFKNKLLTLPNVDHVTTSGTVPGGSYNWDVHMSIAGKSEEEGIPGSNVYVIFTDIDFPETYRLTLKAGRNWDPNRPTDMHCVLINEASIIPFHLGTAEQAVGQKVVFDKDTLTIIGVVKNFYWESLKVDHRQTVLWPVRTYTRRTSVHITGNVHRTIESIDKIFKEYFPGNTPDHYFLDDFYNRMYNDEIKFGVLTGVFSGLATIIACLGLFGLATFTTTQRMKEISIRKVFGASVKDIAQLMSWQFALPLFLATLLAIPLSWVGASSWLDNFPVRVSISWALFATPIFLLFLVAGLSTVFQVLRGARSNPATVLRGE